MASVKSLNIELLLIFIKLFSFVFVIFIVFIGFIGLFATLLELFVVFNLIFIFLNYV